MKALENIIARRNDAHNALTDAERDEVRNIYFKRAAEFVHLEPGQLLVSEIDPIHEETRAGDVRHSQASVDLAKKYLGYEGSVSLDEGLRRTVDWYRDNT